MKRKVLLIAVGALAAFSTIADAQRVPGGMAGCRRDIATFCAGIEAGGGRKVQCLVQNEARLSPDCATVVHSRQGRRGAITVDGSSGLAQAPSPLPPPLTAPAVPPAGQMITGQAPPAGKGGKGRLAACQVDIATHCTGVAAGRGARIACLRQNQATLVAECAAALEQRRQQRAGNVPSGAGQTPPATPAPKL